MVTVDRVRPAHFEGEPESGTTAQRQTKPKPKSTTPKPAAITRKPQKVRARSSGTTTLKSLKTGADTSMSTQTWSSTLGIGTSLAITLQSDATRATCLDHQHYKAPNSRITTAPRANGDSGSF